MNKALIIIDMQNDFLKNQEKNIVYKDIDTLVSNINKNIEKNLDEGNEIIYIKQIIPNNILGRGMFGITLKGTEGANIFSGVKIASNNVFEKQFPSAFTNKELKEFINEKEIDTVILCGIDEGACVSATAKAARKLGLKVEMVSNSIGTKYDINKICKIRDNLKNLGIRYI